MNSVILYAYKKKNQNNVEIDLIYWNFWNFLVRFTSNYIKTYIYIYTAIWRFILQHNAWVKKIFQKEYNFYLFFPAICQSTSIQMENTDQRQKSRQKIRSGLVINSRKLNFTNFSLKFREIDFTEKNQSHRLLLLKEKNPIDSPNVRTSLYILLHTKSTPPIVV